MNNITENNEVHIITKNILEWPAKAKRTTKESTKTAIIALQDLGVEKLQIMQEKIMKFGFKVLTRLVTEKTRKGWW